MRLTYAKFFENLAAVFTPSPLLRMWQALAVARDAWLEAGGCEKCGGTGFLYTRTKCDNGKGRDCRMVGLDPLGGNLFQIKLLTSEALDNLLNEVQVEILESFNGQQQVVERTRREMASTQAEMDHLREEIIRSSRIDFQAMREDMANVQRDIQETMRDLLPELRPAVPTRRSFWGLFRRKRREE